jgi:predicted GNAT family N-acyltransferase
MTEVHVVETPEAMELAFSIRRRVFVDGQGVPADLERDGHDAGSRHVLARFDGVPCGTARWRITPNGVKLERFAVLPEYQGRGVGQALVRAILDDVSHHPDTVGLPRYLHAQLSAVSLYERFGFRPEGDRFLEAGIVHAKMVV